MGNQSALRFFSCTVSTKQKVEAIKVYSNADTCKAVILKDNKGKTGIYRWVNLINGKSYIGSALDLRERFTNYFNINHLVGNSSMSICLALIKYGYSAFKLEILEYCNLEERFIRETYYIKICAPEYNILKEGGTMPSRLGVSHSEDTKIKIRLNNPNRFMISVTDILTNVEIIYDSINQAEKALDISSGQISQYFNKNQQKPLKKRYVFKKNR